MGPGIFFQLVRLPLTPSALADSFAGYFLASLYSMESAGGEAVLFPGSPGRLALAGAASILAYWAGMVTNDLFDIRKDRQSSPHRPLARGAVSPAAAAALAAVFLGLGSWLAYLAGAGRVFPGLAAAILLYNGGGKNLPVAGNLLMGSCRSLNYFLGAAAAMPISRFPDSPYILFGGALTGLYIALVTAISRLEDRPYHPRPIQRLLLLLMGVPVGLLLASLNVFWSWINSGLFLGTLARALRLPSPESVPSGALHPAAGAVRSGLSGIYFLNAGYLFSHGLWAPALLIHGLWVLGWLCRRIGLKSAATN